MCLTGESHWVKIENGVRSPPFISAAAENIKSVGLLRHSPASFAAPPTCAKLALHSKRNTMRVLTAPISDAQRCRQMMCRECLSTRHAPSHPACRLRQKCRSRFYFMPDANFKRVGSGLPKSSLPGRPLLCPPRPHWQNSECSCPSEANVRSGGASGDTPFDPWMSQQVSQA